MKITAVNNESEYKNALVELEKIFDAKKGSNEFEDLKVLSDLFWNYEEFHFKIDESDPEEAKKFRAEQIGDFQG